VDLGPALGHLDAAEAGPDAVPAEIGSSSELAQNAKTKKVKPDDEPAEEPRKEKLAIKPKGKAKRKLNGKGKAKVTAEVTYTPTAAPRTPRTRRSSS
jgi:hypothetical protein